MRRLAAIIITLLLSVAAAEPPADLAVALGPDGTLTVKRGEAVVWSGACTVQGSADPELRFLPAQDPLGATAKAAPEGEGFGWRKTFAAATLTAKAEGQDV